MFLCITSVLLSMFNFFSINWLWIIILFFSSIFLFVSTYNYFQVLAKYTFIRFLSFYTFCFSSLYLTSFSRSIFIFFCTFLLSFICFQLFSVFFLRSFPRLVTFNCLSVLFSQEYIESFLFLVRRTFNVRPFLLFKKRETSSLDVVSSFIYFFSFLPYL